MKKSTDIARNVNYKNIWNARIEKGANRKPNRIIWIFEYPGNI